MDYERFINELEIKVFYSGLTEEDYQDIEFYLACCYREFEPLNPYSINYSYLHCLKSSLMYWKNALGKGLFNKIHPDNIKYLKENTYLLPLVYANNQGEHIRLYSEDSYMFLCQFHNENSPSMGITNYRNLFHCFGCCNSGNQFDYLMNYEYLTFIESVYFLVHVYLIPFPNNPFEENNPLINKYRNALISNDFLDLLKRGLSRIEKNKGSNYQLIKNNYLNLLNQIERIKLNEKDYSFHYTPKMKKLILDIPNFK